MKIEHKILAITILISATIFFLSIWLIGSALQYVGHKGLKSIVNEVWEGSNNSPSKE